MGTRTPGRISFYGHMLHIPNFSAFARIDSHRAAAPYPDHTHNGTMEICYCARGTQTYRVGRYHTFGSGEVFITFPDEVHGTGEKPLERTLMYFLRFNMKDHPGNFLGLGEHGEMLRGALLALKRRTFRLRPDARVMLDDIAESYRSLSAVRGAMIHGLFAAFLSMLIEDERTIAGGTLSPAIRAVTEHIRGNTGERIPMSELASIAHLSAPHFKRRFKQETGFPPREFILREKIASAEQLLIETDTPITDIAYSLMFSSSQYFATVFRSYTGSSPEEFRTLRRKKQYR